MKLSNTALVAILAASTAVEAAPAAIHNVPATMSTSVEQRSLEQALAELEQLSELKRRGTDEMGLVDIQAREYALITQILTAVKNSNLVPVVVKFFIDNPALRKIAIDAVVLIIKLGLISLKTLLQYLVQLGLLSRVLLDLLNDCHVYANVLLLVRDVLGNILNRLFKQTKRELYTQEEELAMYERDGLLKHYPTAEAVSADAEKRDLHDIIINVLQSVANSGLGTSVVEAALTDPNLIDFGVQLIQALVQNNLINLGSIISAVAQLGLLQELIKDIVNIPTLKNIIANVLLVMEGKCGASAPKGLAPANTANAAPTPVNTAAATTPAANTPAVTSAAATAAAPATTTPATTRSGGLIGGLLDIVGNALGKINQRLPTTTPLTVAGVLTALNPCETQAKREFKRLRVNY